MSEDFRTLHLFFVNPGFGGFTAQTLTASRRFWEQHFFLLQGKGFPSQTVWCHNSNT